MGEYRVRTGRKQRISIRQRRRIQLLSAMFVVLLVVFAVFFLTQKNRQALNEQDLTVRQLSCFMSFYEYDEQQWYEYLQQLGMEDEVSWDGLEVFLNALGIKDHLSYERPKQTTTVSYGEFLSLYEQILSLLDGDKTVTQQTLTVEQITATESDWEGGSLIAGEKTFQVPTSINEYQRGSTYVLYVKDQVILGIIRLCSLGKEENRVEWSYIDDEDPVTVLIKNGSSAYRDKMYLLIEGNYTKTGLKGTEKELESGYLLKFTNCEEDKDPEEDQYILLEPEQEDCRIYFADKNGSKLSEGYRGNFRIYRYKKGYVVLNVLSIGQYLYGVVPSEMPSSYGKEALKAQAVCARSYTYKHLQQKGTAGFYADLDDSVQYQVYNKSQDSEATRRAVDETADQVLIYQDDLAVTYYFSTSCGVTQGYELWGLDKEEFGYLTPCIVHEKEESLLDAKEADLSQEENFKAFLNLDTEGFYEADCRYFRWKATLNYKEYSKELAQAILQRKKASDKSVEIVDEDGKAISDPEILGTPKKIVVKQRSSAGGITSLLIQYEKGSVELKTEYTIRFCIGACNPDVELSDDSVIQPELLPSACFYISSQKNGKVVLRGGGFGHGLGMSQNGADKLAQAGWTYKDILQFFYHGVELVEMNQ